jgi:hypothetical protein
LKLTNTSKILKVKFVALHISQFQYKMETTTYNEISLVRTSQGVTKLSPVLQLENWILVLVQKDRNTKTESYSCTAP